MVTCIGGIGVVSVVSVVVQKRKHDNVNNDDNFALLFMLSCFISDGHGAHSYVVFKEASEGEE